MTDKTTKQTSTVQEWVEALPFMQQTVLLSAIRGADGMAKFHKYKPLVRWFRRCILVSAFDGRALTDPFEPGGGSFMGPIAELPDNNDGVFDLYYSEVSSRHMSLEDWKSELMSKVVDDFMDSRDELPAHYRDHFMHAAEVLGYKHPNLSIRLFWRNVYKRMVHALHTWPETEEQMDSRLGDTIEGWEARSDESNSCSD